MQNLTFNLKTLIIWIVITYLTQVSCLLLVTNQKNISKEKRTKGVSTAKCITTYNFLGQNVCATLCISAKNYKESLLFTLKSFLPIVIFFQIILRILFWSQTKHFSSHFICVNIYYIQVNNHEIVVIIFHISYNLTWHSAIVHKFTRIYPVCSTYVLAKQFI